MFCNQMYLGVYVMTTTHGVLKKFDASSQRVHFKLGTASTDYELLSNMGF